jgi:hypothetical protein
MLDCIRIQIDPKSRGDPVAPIANLSFGLNYVLAGPVLSYLSRAVLSGNPSPSGQRSNYVGRHGNHYYYLENMVVKK